MKVPRREERSARVTVAYRGGVLPVERGGDGNSCINQQTGANESISNIFVNFRLGEMFQEFLDEKRLAKCESKESKTRGEQAEAAELSEFVPAP